jgi:hypothetical protein
VTRRAPSSLRALCHVRSKKKAHLSAPRVFDGRVIMPGEIEIHKEVLKFERIEAISDPMRELIDSPARYAGSGASAVYQGGGLRSTPSRRL